MTRRWLVLAMMLGCGTATGQGFGTTTTACVVASACPEEGAPSYQTAIVPLLERTCIGCHGPSGQAGYYETTYADVYSQRSPILDQVSGCLMPPALGPDGMPVQQLSPAERVTLTSWLECGAPDN